MSPLDRDELCDLLDEYVQRLQAGEQPNRQALVARFPELAELVNCLEALESMAPCAEDREEGPPSPAAPSPFGVAPTVLVQGGPALESAEPHAGGKFGKYELLEEIGRGGMGVVFKARQMDLDRLVALKMILSGHLATSDQIQRFYTEARAAARLQHPGIVNVHEVGHYAGQHYFAMEYIEGPSLAQIVSQGPIDPRQAAELLATVARAVDHLHAQGIIHRDLKPANILLRNVPGQKAGDLAGCQPVVSDFGLAKLLSASEALTRSGAIFGTPSYMAPEQAAGQSQGVGPASDVYSLGVILYESLTGTPPFRSTTPVDTILQVLERDPVPPRQLDPRIPLALDAICLACLEKSPERRYRSAAELAADLDRYLAGEPVTVGRGSLVKAARRWGRRQPALALRLVAFLLFVGAQQVLYHGLGFSEPPYYFAVLVILNSWALASLGFQRLLEAPRWKDLAPFGWAAADVLCVTGIALAGNGASSPAVVGYPLVVALAGLWTRIRLVWFTTILAVVLYLVVALVSARWPELARPPDHHIVFMLALIVLGLVTTQQVGRIRILTRLAERPPEPSGR